MLNYTIYTYDTSSHQVMVIFLICLILILVVAGAILVIRSTFWGWELEDGTRLKYKDWEILTKVLFRYVPLTILTIGVLGLSRLVITYYNYGYQMEQGKYEVVEGNVKVVSYQEKWYRDSFLGYEVTFEIDNNRFTPSNSFDMSIVSALESDAHFQIYYGYMKDELFVWQIDVTSQ